MKSTIADLMVAATKLAAVQVRFGLIAAEVSALGVRQMVGCSEGKPVDQSDSHHDAQVNAAATAIKARMLAGREGGFRNILQVNFSDDEIRALAEAALDAARGK